MNITTIKQLDEWMTANCYNDSYGIGNRTIHEGYGLEKWGTLYIWYYTERGKQQNLKYFGTEQEAVAYAFNAITSDRSASRHLVGFLKSKVEEAALLEELQKRNVEFWKDEIPYGGINDPRIRIFVFGCAIKKVLDLLEKYGQWK